MFEWIVSSLSSFFVPPSSRPTVSRSSANSKSSSSVQASVLARQRTPTEAVSPIKRNYRSIQTSSDDEEWIESKRPRLDAIFDFVKRAVGVFGFYKSLPSPQTDSQATTTHIFEVRECDSCKKSRIGRMDLKTEICAAGIIKEGGKSCLSHQTQAAASFIKQRVAGSENCSVKQKFSDLKDSYNRRFLPSTQSSGTVLSNTSSSTRNPNSLCLTLKEGFPERDQEQYWNLLELVSEEYLKQSKQTTLLSRPKTCVSSCCQPVYYKPLLKKTTCTNTTAQSVHVKATSTASEPDDICLSRPVPHRKIDGHYQSTFEHVSENNPGCEELIRGKRQPEDVDLSAEVEARLRLVDREADDTARKSFLDTSVSSKEIKATEDFPKLTKDMEDEVQKALSHSNPDEVLSSAFKQRITCRDLQTLGHQRWLNDEVINFYMNLLITRSEQEGGLKVYAFNTFFFPKLCAGGYQAVRRWTKGMDIFEKDVIFVPLHLGVHWCLAVVDFRVKEVKYYDSTYRRNDDICWILLHYLKEEYKFKKKEDLHIYKWTVTSAKPGEVPQQMNGSDCGVFACKYADYIARDKPINFTQKNMPYFRRRMVWEILNQKLL
ncbi:sentrin-specific protease 2 isoform X1 [Polypterus senegalus]|uniref:sentrin-specific protease 2 isoform X1 n=1 Tax=Polypterus senegalus TaxID=55291 RepID=UPI0019635415|nr:sentrin-specific protease 2 isoform X1 [Polypterus senegalus]